MRNPFPGVTVTKDRHGKRRYRFRVKGKAACYLPGEYGSAEFRSAYEAALKGSLFLGTDRLPDAGTFDYVIEHYMRTPQFQKLSPIYRRNLTYQFERFRQAYGKGPIADLTPFHVERIVGKKADTPAAANELLKLIRKLCRFAIKRGWLASDPTLGAERFATNPDGFHTWTEAEIAQFEAFHGEASKAVLGLRIMLWTGAARQDAAAMGRQNIKGGRIEYRRNKTGQAVTLPLTYMLELVEAIERVPADQMIFVTHGRGRTYSPETFGNWFRDQCVAAGLPHCSTHGLRKAGATRLANAGASEHEIMAFLGHRTPNEARTYTKAANRATLADSGMEKLKNVSNRVERLDNHRRK